MALLWMFALDVSITDIVQDRFDVDLHFFFYVTVFCGTVYLSPVVIREDFLEKW